MIIYAATKGYLDDVSLDQIAAWEAAFYRYMDANHPEIGQEIVEKSVKQKNKMSNDFLNKLNAAIEEFKKTAAPGNDQTPQARAASARTATAEATQTATPGSPARNAGETAQAR
jgi:F-type H+-transporting ATPase subunit alpha